MHICIPESDILSFPTIAWFKERGKENGRVVLIFKHLVLKNNLGEKIVKKENPQDQETDLASGIETGEIEQENTLWVDPLGKSWKKSYI